MVWKDFSSCSKVSEARLRECKNFHIKISTFCIMQELESDKYQGFNVVRKVKYTIFLRYKRQISKFYYFAWSIICQFSVIKISIRCAMYNIEFVFITKVKYQNYFASCKIWKLSKIKLSVLCTMQNINFVFIMNGKYENFHSAKSGNWQI